MKKNRISFGEWFEELAKELDKSNRSIFEFVKDTNNLPICSVYKYINEQGLTTVYEKLYSFLGQGVDNDDYRRKLMDYDLIVNNYQKWLSPVWLQTMTTISGSSTIDKETQLHILSRIILSKFGEKWERIISTFYADYNPIHNYDMDETEKEKTDVKYKDTNDVSTYGFNSTEPSPVNKTEYERNITGDLDKNVRTLTRSGNIGVTTSQQMIESELKIRGEYSIWNEILKDVSSILFIQVY